MEPEKKSNGVLIGLVVIIIILVVGGVYLWQANKKVADNTNIQTESVVTTDSAELDTLQQEIDTTNTDVGASVIDSVQ